MFSLTHRRPFSPALASLGKALAPQATLEEQATATATETATAEGRAAARPSKSTGVHFSLDTHRDTCENQHIRVAIRLTSDTEIILTIFSWASDATVTLQLMPIEPLSFNRVEYDGAASIPFLCAFCGRGMDDVQFEIDSRPVCVVCATRIAEFMPTDNRKTFLRSAGFGVLAALGAALVYFLLLRLLWQLQFTSIAILSAVGVGWMIGKAMSVGARGAGGRRYQWTGATLAYAAAVYPLQFILLGIHESAWWVYPIALLRPVAFLFTDLRTLAVLQLMAALVAIR